MVVRKIAFSFFSFLLIQSITASEISQAELDDQMAFAIRKNNIDKIIDLLQTSADVNATTNVGETALSRLCDYTAGTKGRIRRLDESAEKILAQQQYHKSLDAIDLLLCKGANPNALFFLADCNWYQFPEFTISFFAYISYGHNNINQLNIDLQDTNGDTPLHKAMRSKKYDLTLCLLELGADASIKNNKKQTPVDLSFCFVHETDASIKKNKKQTPTVSSIDLSSFTHDSTVSSIDLSSFTHDSTSDLSLTEENVSPKISVRAIQMPFYKQNKRGNICTLIHQRASGIKPRIGM